MIDSDRRSTTCHDIISLEREIVSVIALRIRSNGPHTHTTMYRPPHRHSIAAMFAVSAYLTRALVVRDTPSGTPTALAVESSGSTTSSSAAPFFTSGGFVGQQSDNGSERDVTKVLCVI